ncbi:ATP-binding protein [Hansschlegelia quercus]|uniref:histidine kinase n=1 Tax=Hansschlegelia quercus TaxID=2528245 RepID=A0A4Q9GRH1_9HYPH|nr:PAS domain-containing sensor histidine kinase [Hansschlegelia quercus]TBN54347.1 PAS domain-containing sensor histidine kinase [Hansschlegelia quercus]
MADAALQSEPNAPRERRGPGLVGPICVVAALISALVSFVVLTGRADIEPTEQASQIAIIVNGGFVALLVIIIIWEVRGFVLARWRAQAGSQIHGRLVALFSIVAVAPAALLAVFALVTIDKGFDSWFSTRVREIVDNSLVVARAYLNEHARSIRGEILAMANDVNRARPLFDNDRQRFAEFFTAQATIRGLPEAQLLKRDMTVVERAKINIGRDFPHPPQVDIDSAPTDEPTLLAPGKQNAIGAVLKLENYDDLVLFVARPVDPRANTYMQLVEQGSNEYNSLTLRRPRIQATFALLYLLVSLSLLLAAIWLGLAFANRLASPIRRLITAADQVSQGDLYVQVPIARNEGDLGALAETFNKMTSELRSQRNRLVEAADQMDSRRRFTEAMLAGVSAGVIGIDPAGAVTLMNRMAEKIVGEPEETLLGRRLREAAPELGPMIDAAIGRSQRLVQGQVTLLRGGRERVLNVRFTTETSTADEHGYVVTLDDITELVSAQRTSAWADVARRIAHEIKNPLTPIQLSAERIRRKYGKVIVDEREIFEQCTDTIIRQVDDIKRMVDEFSSFARMPKPTIEEEDLANVVRQGVFMMRVGYPDIAIEAHGADQPVKAKFDRRLIAQAVTNIVKNATESVHATPEGVNGEGRIDVFVRREGDSAVVEVVDNGAGLPVENRQRLLEPYMTTREKGTGLGLAIVGKIMEEHGGGVELLDAPAVAEGGRGAMVRLWFKARTEQSAPAPAAPAA